MNKIIPGKAYGKPGAITSAKIDVYDEGIIVDVGQAVKDELAELEPEQQRGYKEDATKYAEQIKKYKEMK
jgi:hypothetical protein